MTQLTLILKRVLKDPVGSVGGRDEKGAEECKTNEQGFDRRKKRDTALKCTTISVIESISIRAGCHSFGSWRQMWKR
ncbi:hypothetical protein Nepgr_001526 [Nepenthes gracilis]|uniref:Uncharacterized protein n=1 Tax=Nepenthes gracilis TaxID=150966 RepID=A0AAD3RW47_NEPGR|nr:hypothetical protein Nepgr_001526 [Nepenthes gracilis]